MPLCPSTETRPTTDEEWYEELLKQSNADEDDAPIQRDI